MWCFTPTRPSPTSIILKVLKRQFGSLILYFSTMFFSTEYLTSRNSGFSTAWLMATLGSKPFANRVNKHEILSTPVSKVCSLIETPPGPLALRLSSQLLYGVSLIYDQQITYLLTDVSGIKSKLMHFEPLNRSRHAVDGTVNLMMGRQNKVRNELVNDPAFSLDFFLLPPGPPPTLVGKEPELLFQAGLVGGNTSIADITLLNDSIEHPAEGRDFLGSLIYGMDLDVGGVDFDFGENGEMIEDDTVNGGGSEEFNFDLPERPEEASSFSAIDPNNENELLYNFGSSDDMNLDELRTAALAGNLPSELQKQPKQLQPPTPVEQIKTSKKRVCEFDQLISLPIEALRGYRDNYADNMETAKRRRASRQHKKTITFPEFAKVALGQQFAKIFHHDIRAPCRESTAADLARGYQDNDTNPGDIEFGRRRESDLRRTPEHPLLSPASISVSDRVQGSPSPIMRSSRLIPSDLGDIPELSSNYSFGFNDVYEDVIEDLGLEDLAGFADDDENGLSGVENENDSDGNDGKMPRRFDNISKFLRYASHGQQQRRRRHLLQTSDDCDHSSRYILFNELFPKRETTRRQAASAFSQLLKVVTMSRGQVRFEQDGGGESRIWVLV